MLTSSSNLGWSQLARRDSGLMKHSLIQNFGVKIMQGWLNWFTRLWWHVALTTERICAGNKEIIFPHFAYFLSLILYKETFPVFHMVSIRKGINRITFSICLCRNIFLSGATTNVPGMNQHNFFNKMMKLENIKGKYRPTDQLNKIKK